MKDTVGVERQDKSVIRPVVVYGSECWTMKKMDEKKLHLGKMKMLRRMCGDTRIEKVMN
jgi:hypothetical protein